MIAWLAAVALASPDADAAVDAACTGGDLEACAYSGARHAAAGDLERASKQLRTACRGDVPVGCRNEGAMLLRAAVPPDPSAALRAYARGCALSDPESCAAAGTLYLGVAGLPRDEARAREALEPACVGEIATACAPLGELVATADAAEGLEWMLRGCTLGDGAACTGAAVRVEQGEGAASDLGRARELLDQGCIRGDGEGCAMLAMRFAQTGRAELASAPLERGCELQAPVACSMLGLARLTGQGGRPKDPAGAVDALMRACALEHASSCTTAGALLIEGRKGVAAAPERGRELLKAGCALGDERACAPR